MAYAKNKVIAGDYEGSSVTAVLGTVYIIGSDERITLDKGTVEFYEMIIGGEMLVNKHIHYLALQFRDGKKSILEVDQSFCKTIIKNCISESAIRCGVTPDKIKSCDPGNLANCSDCICVKCIVWPKCCYGRMFARRASYSKLVK